MRNLSLPHLPTHPLLRRAAVLLLLLALMGALGLAAEVDYRLELLTHLRLHGAMVAALFALLFFAARQPAWGGTALLIALWQGSLLWQPRQLPPLTAPPLRELTLLQYNLNSQNRQLESFIAWLNHHPRPDVVLLFEVTERHQQQLQPLMAAWSRHQTIARADNFGIALWADGGQIEVVPPLTPSAPPLLKWVQPDLTLFAAHPPPPIHPLLAEERNGQLRQLATLAAQARSVIVAGDLNLTPWSPYFAALLQQGQLYNAERFPAYAGTFPAVPIGLALPIDQTLHSANLRPLSRQILTEISGSDHHAVLTRLQLYPAAVE